MHSAKTEKFSVSGIDTGKFGIFRHYLSFSGLYYFGLYVKILL
jgi:hypothetical protein